MGTLDKSISSLQKQYGMSTENKVRKNNKRKAVTSKKLRRKPVKKRKIDLFTYDDDSEED